MGCSAVPLIKRTTGALEIIAEMWEKDIKKLSSIFLIIAHPEKQLKAGTTLSDLLSNF
jgi:hypothetical protein